MKMKGNSPLDKFFLCYSSFFIRHMHNSASGLAFAQKITPIFREKQRIMGICFAFHAVHAAHSIKKQERQVINLSNTGRSSGVSAKAQPRVAAGRFAPWKSLPDVTMRSCWLASERKSVRSPSVVPG